MRLPRQPTTPGQTAKACAGTGAIAHTIRGGIDFHARRHILQGMVAPACTDDTCTELELSGSGIALAASRHAPPGRAAATPAVVYAHGFGQTRRAWSATAARLSAHGHAGLAYDARGHGGSGRNPASEPYTGRQFTDDLIVLSGALPRPPVLVAASMGGLFGLLAEARWPG